MKLLHFALRRVAFSLGILVALSIFSFSRGVKGQDGSVLASSQVLANPFPYDFPDQTHTGSGLFTMQLCHGLKLEEATIEQLQKWLRNGKLTSVQLVTCYIQRNTQIDGYVR